MIHELGKICHRDTEPIRGRKQSEVGIGAGVKTCKVFADRSLHFRPRYSSVSLWQISEFWILNSMFWILDFSFSHPQRCSR